MQKVMAISPALEEKKKSFEKRPQNPKLIIALASEDRTTLL